ncbi:MAG: hypothetical protein ACI3WR_00290 [Oscillospiraceae bacterium]
MDISVVVCTVLAAIAILVLIAAGYLRLYTRAINRALVTKGRKPPRMIPPYKVVAALAAALVIAAALCLSGMNRITTARDMEESLRKSQTIREDWNIEIAMSDSFAAALAYDDGLTDHSFAVYRNTGRLFENYQFRYGGHTVSVEQSVSVYKYDGMLALLSMNALHIARIQCHDGETYEIDPDSPFVLILPDGGFDAYDSAGKLIDLEQDRWYEVREAN